MFDPKIKVVVSRFGDIERRGMLYVDGKYCGGLWFDQIKTNKYSQMLFCREGISIYIARDVKLEFENELTLADCKYEILA